MSRKKIVEEIKEDTKKLYTPEVGLEINLADFSIGNFVKIKNTSTSGRITQIDRDKNKAIIESGTIKMQVGLNELLLDKTKKKDEQEKHYHNFKFPETNYRLDIRGQKPEEKLEQYPNGNRAWAGPLKGPPLSRWQGSSGIYPYQSSSPRIGTSWALTINGKRY